MKFRFGLLPRVVLAIGLGGGCGFFFPVWATRIALTFNDIFGQFLSFVIPLLILGLVAPGIADLGRNAGRLLALTAALAYAFTLFSGFGTYLTGQALFPALLEGAAAVLPDAAATAPAPYFTVGMPPLFGVMSALVLAFVLGLGMALYAQRETQRGDGRFQVDHRPRDRGRHHPAAALLYLRNLPFDDPVRAGGRGAGRLREADRGDLLHDRRAAARTVLRCRARCPQKPAADAPYDAYGLCHGARHAIVGRHHPRDAGADPPAGRASRIGVVRHTALCHDPPLGVDDEDRGLCIGRFDAGRAGYPGGDFCGVHSAAGRDDDRRTGGAGRRDHGGAGIARVDARVRRDARGADDRHLHRHGQLRHGDQRDGRRCRRGDRRCDRPPIEKMKNRTKFFPGPPKAAFFHIKYPEISINAYPCRIKNG